MATKISYHLRGILLGSCNCDWGCPCNFEAPPTKGFCEGDYIWLVEEGNYGQVQLNGLNFAWCAHSPGPIHLGNLTSLYLVDERSNFQQRRELEEMLTKDLNVIPFGIFTSLTRTMLGVRYVPFEIELNGTSSSVKVPDILELQLTPLRNPVTGEVEPATLIKPKGFTSKEQELCSTSAARLTSEGLTYNNSGKYGEFSRFEYQGP